MRKNIVQPVAYPFSDMENWGDDEEEEEQEPPRRLGRGRGRGKAMLPPQKPAAPLPPPIPEPEVSQHRSFPIEAQENAVEQGQSTPLNKKGKLSKASPYVMFLQYMKQVNGVMGNKSIPNLIKMFDKDWKALPDEEKAIWRAKAKAVDSTPSPPPNSEDSAPRVAAPVRAAYFNFHPNQDL